MTLYINYSENRLTLFPGLFLAVGLCLSIAGCGGGDSSIGNILTPAPTQPEQTRAEQLAANGNWLASAQAWREQATKQDSPQREASLLNAADMLLRAHAHDDARQMLNDIVIVNATPALKTQLQFLKTRLALAERRPADALVELDVLNGLQLDIVAQTNMLKLRADIFAQTGHHFEAARQRILLDGLLENTEQAENQNQVWEALDMLSPVALSTLRDSDSDPLVAGWLDLAWLVKSAHQQGDRLSLALEDWKRRYPLHPADKFILPTLKTLDQIPVSNPQRVALLLPLDGKFSNAARAVRDGFLNAYYARPVTTDDITVRIYSADSNNVVSVYEQAVANGANIVVGPLDKDALLSLLTLKEFKVPVLALNDIPQSELPANVYSYALTPEDEARQVAEHIWLDGHSRGIALYPQGRWGERVFEAFRTRWQELGGELLEANSYDAEGRDFATPIRDVLNIDESRTRHHTLKNVLNEDIKFEMRRRQDVDFVFLAAYPKQARQLRPQFDFHNAGNLPVYATSHVYSGTPDRNADRDMNGIIFGDMPWTLDKHDSNSALRAAAQRNWGKDRESYTRLFAFGADAWQVLPHLERLSRYRFARFNGNTGSLRINETGRIQRGLNWATFSAGKPRIIQPPLLAPTPPAIEDPLTAVITPTS